MKQNFSYGLLILVAGILIGLSVSSFSCGPLKVEGLILVDGTTSIGQSDDDPFVSFYNYNFTLYNSGQENIYVTTIEPILAENPYILSSQKSVREVVNKNLTPGSFISVEGTIRFDSGNATKEELMDFEPILYINVSSTETIPYFNAGSDSISG